MRRPVPAPGLLLALFLPACAPVPDAPAERLRLLEPAWRILRPEGAGPHPAAVLLSGCDGVRDNMDLWAREMVARGRVALILDSHGPRGIGRAEASLVCVGAELRGAERAGDLAVALAALGREPGVDGRDVVVLGASHGGWTAMELVRLAGSGEVPPGLAAWPEPPGETLGRLSALVLVYPYCGLLNGARGWEGGPPALMVLGGEDRVVSTPACLERAGALGIEAAVVAGADHGFDQRERPAISPLVFDAAQTGRARWLVARFLDRLGL